MYSMAKYNKAMQRDTILDRLAAAKAELHDEHGVKRIRLFGSAAHGDTQTTSDVDLLVEFADDRPIGLFELIRLQRRLQQILEVEHVDLVTPEGLHPALRPRIEAEAIDAA